MTPASVVLLFAGCTSDQGLNGIDKHDGTDTGDTGGGPPVDTDFSDVCEGLSGSPHDVALNDECDQDIQTGSFTPVTEYTYGKQSFCGPPGVGQIVDSNLNGSIDSDDLPAILLYQGGMSGMGNGKAVALKGDGSGTYWETGTGMGQDGGFALGDLDNDGFPEVVTASTTQLRALDGQTGSTKWTSENLTGHVDPLGYNYPNIADMDGDGQPEVTVGNVILNGKNGKTLMKGSKGFGAAPYGGLKDLSRGTYGALSVPVDLDGDGQMELVTGNTAYNLDGSIKWENGSYDGLIAVADFDGDGEGEIVKTSGIYVYGMETDGTEVWGPVKYGSSSANTNLGAAAIDDLDGDGEPDIVFAAQNALIAMEWGGTEKWRAPITDSSGAAGPVLFDFELDGYPEVLYSDEQKVRFFSGLDGKIKFEGGGHSSYTILETPTVADVDNDDQVEIIMGHCGNGATVPSAITVYGDADGSWPPGRKVWNQHAYQITNVGDLGEVPKSTAPNWPEYNSFRSGDVGRPPGEWYDVQAEIFDVCEDECDDGKVYVGAWLMNAGNLEIPAGVPVSLRAGAGGSVLATQVTTEAVPVGKTGEALFFEVTSADLSGKKPVVEGDLDGDGAGLIYECNEDNNANAWSDAACK